VPSRKSRNREGESTWEELFPFYFRDPPTLREGSSNWCLARRQAYRCPEGIAAGLEQIREGQAETGEAMVELLMATWLATATVRELPGEPPLVLAVGTTVPSTATWPDLARAVACRSFTGAVLTYLLVWMPGEYGEVLPAAFHRQTVSCRDPAIRAPGQAAGSSHTDQGVAARAERPSPTLVVGPDRSAPPGAPGDGTGRR
jgi:hypothetical protein